jgi:hypothetical protein
LDGVLLRHRIPIQLLSDALHEAVVGLLGELPRRFKIRVASLSWAFNGREEGGDGGQLTISAAVVR